ncbi:hypothetical protein FA13DRAFT_1799041 [Coprinellus micaceus]|uniref:CxC6 like cysteine cluster associated with KDZ domain-containing protein n=1 Tax=Coprinellus micaceus TaxID=71717 RepID=A0A4Y7SKZ4_COPMI|nr:hypothetical protein FA13DRAFT_1799041 [Coprinellus micaceus]
MSLLMWFLFTSAGVIVCIDACFVHKRCNLACGPGLDPPLRHPSFVFLTAEEIEHAHLIVEAAHPAHPSHPAQAPPDSSGDTTEPGMKVPQSVLNACSDSFKAADEMLNKWQFYAIALFIKLFKALSENMTVGVLYDIGCQLHHSCTKWDFIPPYVDHIIWGISIFHAYGHQWPCQLIYHPQKCSGFGLSDGKGCECFWSSIQGLVPSLHVSGYHQRIFTIDLQVEFFVKGGDDWIGEHMQEELQSLWKDQVEVQIRSIVAATATLAKGTIQSVLDLMDYIKSINSEIDTLDKAMDGWEGE